MLALPFSSTVYRIESGDPRDRAIYLKVRRGKFKTLDRKRREE